MDKANLKTKISNLRKKENISDDDLADELVKIMNEELNKKLDVIFNKTVRELINDKPLEPEKIREGAEKIGLVQGKVSEGAEKKKFDYKGLLLNPISTSMNFLWNNPKLTLLTSLIGISSDNLMIYSVALLPFLIILTKGLYVTGSTSFKTLSKGKIVQAGINALYFVLILLLFNFTLQQLPFVSELKTILMSIYKGTSFEVAGKQYQFGVEFIIDDIFGGIKKVTINNFYGVIKFISTYVKDTLKLFITVLKDIFGLLGNWAEDTKVYHYINWLKGTFDRLGSFLDANGIKQTIKTGIDIVIENAEAVSSTIHDAYTILKHGISSFKVWSGLALPSSSVSNPLLQLPSTGGGLQNNGLITQYNQLDLTEYQLDNINIINNKVVLELIYLYEHLFSLDNLSKPQSIICNGSIIYTNQRIIEYTTKKCVDISLVGLLYLIKYKPEANNTIIEESNNKLKILSKNNSNNNRNNNRNKN